MAKLTLQDIANLQNESTVVTTLKSNNDATEIAMERTLSRDGLAPNQMLSNLDMNNYKVINLPDALTAQEPATYSQLTSGLTAVGGGAVTNAAYVTVTPNPLLLSERILTAGTNLSLTDGGANNPVTLAVSDNELNALAATTAAANTVPYFTGTTTAGTTSLTPYARTLIGAADATTARATLGAVTGTNVQAWDADLDAVAGLSTPGLIANTGAGTAASRTLTAPAAGITVTNGDGVAGNPTLVLANDLGALEGLSTTGIARRTATDTWTAGTAVTNAELQNSTMTIGSASTALGGTMTAAVGRGSTALNIDQVTLHGDSIYTILNTDRNVFTNAAFTAPRIWTLPAANTLNAGQGILIADLAGGVGSTNTLTVTRAGADTINGTASVTLNASSTSVQLVSDGTSKWYAVTSSAGGGGGSSFKAYEYTATAAQTTFSGADINGQTLGYTTGFLLVYINGTLQNVADYTATSGTSVVLATVSNLNDQIKIVAMNQSATALLPANNLSDVTSATTARTNIGAAPAITSITSSLGADVAISGSVGTYAAGPSIAQGTSGTWFVSGTVTFLESVTAGSTFKIKLWDGTSIVASALYVTTAVGLTGAIALSGVISSPAGNLRIDVANASTTSGVIKFNSSGNSKDSTITAIRIA